MRTLLKLFLVLFLIIGLITLGGHQKPAHARDVRQLLAKTYGLQSFRQIEVFEYTQSNGL